MNELFNNAPDIIRAAATNPLGLAALVALILGVFAYIHFRNTSELAKVAVFVLMGIALLILFLVSAVTHVVQSEFSEFNSDKKNLADEVANAKRLQKSTSSDPNLATICVTQEATCTFDKPFLEKGSICNCGFLGGLFFSSDGIAR
jgi:hypothetical protein